MLSQTTDLGYAEFRCGACGRKSNERSGTPFNYLELPTDIVLRNRALPLEVQAQSSESGGDVLPRGFEFTHEAVRDGEERFAPLLAEHLRRKRKGKASRRWYVDERT